MSIGHGLGGARTRGDGNKSLRTKRTQGIRVCLFDIEKINPRNSECHLEGGRATLWVRDTKTKIDKKGAVSKVNDQKKNFIKQPCWLFAALSNASLQG